MNKWTISLFDFYCWVIYFYYWPHRMRGCGSNKTKLTPALFSSQEYVGHWSVLVFVHVYSFSFLIKFRLLNIVCCPWFIHFFILFGTIWSLLYGVGFLTVLKTVRRPLDALFSVVLLGDGMLSPWYSPLFLSFSLKCNYASFYIVYACKWTTRNHAWLFVLIYLQIKKVPENDPCNVSRPLQLY